MEQTIWMASLSVWDWLAHLLRDEYFLLWLGFLVGIGFIVNRGVSRLVETQRDLAAGLEEKLEKLSDKLEQKLELLEVDLMADIHREIGYKHGESNGEAILRWLNYRADYGRSGPR